MVQTEQSQTELNLAIVGTYLPRQCGIATFTADLFRAIRGSLSGNGSIFTIAMDDIPEGYDYGSEVKLEIRADMARDYRMAADYLNISPVDVVILQHEFGIFGGGEAGSYINMFLERLRKPIITTLHTVLEDPAPEYRRAMDRLVQICDQIVVMSDRGSNMLTDIYGVDPSQVKVIPHGIPDMPFVDPNFHKDEFNLEGRRMLLTFGLLSPNKGIEVAIKAMPAVVERYPDAIYVVLGATHPHVKRRHGERYRNSLRDLAESLGVTDNVMFINQFVELEELCRYIGATDIYITPYLNRQQITSGTLAYAAGAGRAVVSTPYWYAEELLADNRGKLVEFGDADGFAREILWLFDNEVERHAMRKQTYIFAREMIWSRVGHRYVELAQSVCRHRERQPRAAAIPPHRQQSLIELPEISLQHLHILTDHVGILQHAKFATPDRSFGYCTDDNARALVFAAMHWSVYQDTDILPLAHAYLGFLLNAYNPRVKRFRNFLSYDLNWMERAGSEDCHGRAIWGLATLIANAPDQSLLALATTIFHDALPQVAQFNHTRSIALALVGVHYYLRRFNVDTEVRRMREQLAHKLMDRYLAHADDQWVWCSDILTYSNARVPHAMLLAGQWLPDNRMVQMGLKSLRWLIDIQTTEQGRLSPIGNHGWYRRGEEKARFDQQPIEAMSLVQACIEAYDVTGELSWLHDAKRCYQWFLGYNDLGLPLCDVHTGGCRDGLETLDVNQNQGAESTLSWLIALAAMHLVSRQVRDVQEEQVAVLLSSQDTDTPAK